MNSPHTPNSSPVEILNIAHHLVVQLNPGALEARKIQCITQHITTAIQTGAAQSSGRYVVLAFTNIPLISSLGLAMCVDVYHCAKKNDMKCATYGATNKILDLFHIMHLDRMYENFSTESQMQERLV